MNKIAVVTATRAEYGLLTPLIDKVNSDPELELQLIVTGTHLSEKYGKTESLIIEDGFKIYKRIAILEDGNTPYDISVTMANALKRFAECFRLNRPDMLILLGDRTELLGIAAAALNERIPIAHIHGGEVTIGAVDDCIRHALTKMSFLHFTSTEQYRKRVIQLGENPERVYNVGALGTENILKTSLMSEMEIKQSLGIPQNMRYCVVTFHPITLDEESATKQTLELCKAMANNKEFFYLITMSNSDADGEVINKILREFTIDHSYNAKFALTLGTKRYLSAVKHAAFVLGNSSSGIIEAPTLGTPTVNIGDRQKGRLLAESIVNCEPKEESITHAIGIAESMKHSPSFLYGDGNTSDEILMIIKKYLLNKKIDLKKNFFDISF